MYKQTESREQFEAWMKSRDCKPVAWLKDAYWEVWQACRANSPAIPDGWIKCSEIMPKPYEPVLFFAAGAHGGVDCCASTYNGFHSGSRWLQDATLTNLDLSPPVRNEIVITHWQPIPAPPQEE